jgi:tRNA1(Val) A37 N6-methylase TrmN6
MMNHIPISPTEFTYIDFGCGKGRTLLLAADAGFRRMIGVDIAQDLLDVARRNFESRKGNKEVELICRDVREFEFPDEPFVLFMYNPFYADVMQVVAERLKESVLRNPRPFYVAYYSMACEEVWRDLKFRTLRRNDTTYPYYAIFDDVVS